MPVVSDPTGAERTDEFTVEGQLLTDVGVMTSASGLTWYLADLFPASYRNAVFVAEAELATVFERFRIATASLRRARGSTR